MSQIADKAYGAIAEAASGREVDQLTKEELVEAANTVVSEAEWDFAMRYFRVCLDFSPVWDEKYGAIWYSWDGMKKVLVGNWKDNCHTAPNPRSRDGTMHVPINKCWRYLRSGTESNSTQMPKNN